MKRLVIFPMLLGGIFLTTYIAKACNWQNSTENTIKGTDDDYDDYFALYNKYVTLAEHNDSTKDNCKTPEQHKAFTSPDLQFANLKGHVKEVVDIEASVSDDWYTYYDLDGRFIIANECSEIPLFGDHFKRNSKGYITSIRDYICSGFCNVIWNKNHQVEKLTSKELIIEYYYDEKGLRTKEVHTSDDSGVQTIIYTYNTIDSLGNWLDRVVRCDDCEPYNERRTISYYTK